MDFSLTTLFVAPSGTLASSGSTQDLTADQLGLFRPDYSIATAGNIAAAKYFYIAQGRKAGALPGLGSKKSDKIHTSKVVEWYKTIAEDTVGVQTTKLDTFVVQCDEDVTVTFRVHSNIIDATFFNGLTRSVVVKAPCCDCGVAPCTNITAAQTETLVDALVAKLQADTFLAPYIAFARSGSTSTSTIVATAKVPAGYTNANDLSSLVPQKDRIWFRAFAYTGTPTLSDYFVDDVCEGVTAVATVTNRSTYPSGTSAEVKQLERNYYSYQQSAFKHIYNNPAWNGAFETNVVDGTFYNIYYIKCLEFDKQTTWTDFIPIDFTVIVAFPVGQESAFETALTAALGAPKDNSPLDFTTTTSTSTTTTTTTTASIVIP